MDPTMSRKKGMAEEKLVKSPVALARVPPRIRTNEVSSPKNSLRYEKVTNELFSWKSCRIVSASHASVEVIDIFLLAGKRTDMTP